MKILEKKPDGTYKIEYFDKTSRSKIVIDDVAEDVVIELKKNKKEDDRERKKWKKHCVSLELLEEHGFDTDEYDEEDEDANPEFAYLEKEQIETDRHNRNQLAVNMRKLTPRQREVIIMHFYKGMSFNEIAYALNMEYHAVLDRVRRAIDRLNENIFPPENDDF